MGQSECNENLRHISIQSPFQYKFEDFSFTPSLGLQSPSGSSKVFGNFEAEKVSKLILLYDFSEFLQY